MTRSTRPLCQVVGKSSRSTLDAIPYALTQMMVPALFGQPPGTFAVASDPGHAGRALLIFRGRPPREFSPISPETIIGC